jgi:hypothetical protein
MKNYSSDDFGPENSRTAIYIPLPTFADGVHHGVPATATRVESRFLSALVQFAPPDLLAKAMDYALSDRA